MFVTFVPFVPERISFFHTISELMLKMKFLTLSSILSPIQKFVSYLQVEMALLSGIIVSIISITSASHQHHISITAALHQHHISISSASHQHHICITSASHQPHTSFTSASHQHHKQRQSYLYQLYIPLFIFCFTINLP